MRAVIYARYSSELQSERSIDDQLALCRERASREGWRIVEVFTDYALSGASMRRPGLQALMDGARRSEFDIVLSEALDRLSRDQEDIAGVYKRLSAWQVRLITLSEGEINELHVGLKGTMNALFLKDLAAKSLRGQLGKARQGLAAGGLPYGYATVREIGPDGELVRGKRCIVEEEAEIVRRIFTEFAAGRSSIAIAKRLNADAVPSPRAGKWNPSTIQGHRGRGVGILSNPLYIGRQVFNRHAFVRDPDSGTRRARLKDQREWVEADVPELAILDLALWERVQERLAAVPARRPELNRRPRRIFSGLMRCGACEGTLTIVQDGRYGCATARQKGTCTNKTTMKAADIENLVLDGLQDRLLEPNLIETFLQEYHSELQRLQTEARRRVRSVERDRLDLQRQIDRLVDAIAEGTVDDIGAVGAKLRELEGRLAALQPVSQPGPVTIDLHPKAVEVYKRKVADLATALQAEDLLRDDAANALRGLVDRIVAYPSGKRGAFEIELHGQLAAALNLAKYDNVGGGRGIRTLDTVTRILI